MKTIYIYICIYNLFINGKENDIKEHVHKNPGEKSKYLNPCINHSHLCFIDRKTGVDHQLQSSLGYIPCLQFNMGYVRILNMYNREYKNSVIWFILLPNTQLASISKIMKNIINLIHQ